MCVRGVVGERREGEKDVSMEVKGRGGCGECRERSSGKRREDKDEVWIHSTAPSHLGCTPRPIKKLATGHPTNQGSNASTTDRKRIKFVLLFDFTRACQRNKLLMQPQAVGSFALRLSALQKNAGARAQTSQILPIVPPRNHRAPHPTPPHVRTQVESYETAIPDGDSLHLRDCCIEIVHPSRKQLPYSMASREITFHLSATLGKGQGNQGAGQRDYVQSLVVVGPSPRAAPPSRIHRGRSLPTRCQLKNLFATLCKSPGFVRWTPYRPVNNNFYMSIVCAYTVGQIMSVCADNRHEWSGF